MTDRPVLTAIRALHADMEHMVDTQGRPDARWMVRVLARMLLVPRVRAVTLFRLSQGTAARSLALAYGLQARAIRGSGAELSPLALIGPGLCLMHSVGIVIGPEVVIGRGARIYQGVTLGDGSRPGQPRVGDDVTIGANASILGGISVGNRVVIGAGAVVTRDLPDDVIATGAPATYRSRRPGADPRLDALRTSAVAPDH